MKPLIIAHRCGPGRFPEQSIAAARHALAQGADMVEMDVQYTSDGAPVICHDMNALRMFGVERLCRDMTLSEFQALRHAADPSYASHTLAEVLETSIRPLLLHCKFTGTQLTKLAGFIRDRGAATECVLGVPNAADVGIVHSVSPEIRVLAFMPRLDQLDSFLQSGAAYIRLWEDWVTHEHIDAIHAAGKAIWVMAGQCEEGRVGITTKRALRQWRDMGADGILVNDVAWAIAALEKITG